MDSQTLKRSSDSLPESVPSPKRQKTKETPEIATEDPVPAPTSAAPPGPALPAGFTFREPRSSYNEPCLLYFISVQQDPCSINICMEFEKEEDFFWLQTWLTPAQGPTSSKQEIRCANERQLHLSNHINVHLGMSGVVWKFDIAQHEKSLSPLDKELRDHPISALCYRDMNDGRTMYKPEKDMLVWDGLTKPPVFSKKFKYVTLFNLLSWE